MWLLENSVWTALQSLVSTRTPTAAETDSLIEAARRDDKESFVRKGSKAVVSVEGVLTEKPDFWAWLLGLGNTTYSDIIGAIGDAERDPDVDGIELQINSPGGSVAGLFETLSVIKSAEKPVTAKVTGMAASAAYAIAAQAGSISAVNESVRVGSIGVVVTMLTNKNQVTITSTKAPEKRPDVTTKKGQAVVRKELDGLHDLFVQSISEGRGVSVKDINANFGKGSTVLASEAVERGMIDSVVDKSFSAAKRSKGANEEGAMSREEFKAQYPELYSEVYELGVTSERDRVQAHLKMGESSGAMKIATDAIAAGHKMTESITADYMSASMNRNAVAARDSENEGDASVHNSDEGERDVGAEVASIVEAKLGVKN